jgi:hypothetical protein
VSRLRVIITAAALLVGTRATEAGLILPTASFTVRSAPTFAGCTPLCMDATWGDGGYDGFLTDEMDFDLFTDVTFFEYDLSSYAVPVTSATVTFLINHDHAGGTVFARYYDANGVAETADWNSSATLIAGFAPTVGLHVLDVTAALNAAIFGNYGFLGLRFDYAPATAPWQTNMQLLLPFVTVPDATVPEPASIGLLAMGGLMAAGRYRRRVRKHECGSPR